MNVHPAIPQFIGARVRRREDPALITGQGKYVADIQLEGMLHMAVLRRPYAHARIVSIETSAAREMPGVVAVLTGSEINPHLARPLPTVIEIVAQTLQQVGCPRQITFDRDPRFVGSASSGDFPAAFVRFLACLHIEADICPPQRPQKNCFVERYNRTYKYEAVQRYRPATFTQVVDMNRDVRFHYNYQRPNQARSCGNQPPRLAFPDLPSLPSPPTVVDPDHWLQTINGHLFKRRINHAGTVKVDKRTYYIGRAYHGRYVVLRVEAATQQLVVELEGQKLKELPIKGLQRRQMPLERYLDFIRQQAVSEWRHYLHKTHRYVRLTE
jgi:hypothetical protein